MQKKLTESRYRELLPCSGRLSLLVSGENPARTYLTKETKRKAYTITYAHYNTNPRMQNTPTQTSNAIVTKSRTGISHEHQYTSFLVHHQHLTKQTQIQTTQTSTQPRTKPRRNRTTGSPSPTPRITIITPLRLLLIIHARLLLLRIPLLRRIIPLLRISTLLLILLLLWLAAVVVVCSAALLGWTGVVVGLRGVLWWRCLVVLEFLLVLSSSYFFLLG